MNLEDVSKNENIILGLISISIALAYLGQLGGVLAGIQNTGLDAKVWRNVADSILSGGTPYLSEQDNKPPLWIFFATLAESSGSYVIIMYLTSTIGSILLSVSIYKYVAQTYSKISAILASVIIIEIITNSALFINNKTLAIAIAVQVVRIYKPLRAGLIAGTASAVAQHAGGIVPVIAAHRWTTGDWNAQEAVSYSLLAVCVFLSQYFILGLVWGAGSGIAAFEQTVGSIIPYLSGTGNLPNEGVVANSPIIVMLARSRFVAQHPVIFLMALVGILYLVKQQKSRDLLWIIWLVVFAPMLLLTAFRHYMILVAPAISVIASQSINIFKPDA